MAVQSTVARWQEGASDYIVRYDERENSGGELIIQSKARDDNWSEATGFRCKGWVRSVMMRLATMAQETMGGRVREYVSNVLDEAGVQGCQTCACLNTPWRVVMEAYKSLEKPWMQPLCERCYVRECKAATISYAVSTLKMTEVSHG
jgi:hypothetical protein